MLGTILLILLVLMLIGAVPVWPHSRERGVSPQRFHVITSINRAVADVAWLDLRQTNKENHAMIRSLTVLASVWIAGGILAYGSPPLQISLGRTGMKTGILRTETRQ